MSSLPAPLQWLSGLAGAGPTCERGLHEEDVDWVEAHSAGVAEWMEMAAPRARHDAFSTLSTLLVPSAGYLLLGWSLPLLAFAVLVDLWAVWVSDRLLIARVPNALVQLIERLNTVARGTAVLCGVRRVSAEPHIASAGVVKVPRPVRPGDVLGAVRDSRAAVQLATMLLLPLVLLVPGGLVQQPPDTLMIVLLVATFAARLWEGWLLAARCRRGTPLPPGVLQRVLVLSWGLPCTVLLLMAWIAALEQLQLPHTSGPSGLAAIAIYATVSLALVLPQVLGVRHLSTVWQWWLRADHGLLRDQVRSWRLRHGESTLAELSKADCNS